MTIVQYLHVRNGTIRIHQFRLVLNSRDSLNWRGDSTETTTKTALLLSKVLVLTLRRPFSGKMFNFLHGIENELFTRRAGEWEESPVAS